jgi:hypothetical protein
MSSNDANDRKRKILEAVSSNNGRNPNKERNKAHRVSTIPAALNTTDLQVNTPLVTAKASTANTASTEHEESIRSIGKTHDLMSSFSKCVNSASNLAGFQRTVDKAVTQQELVG